MVSVVILAYNRCSEVLVTIEKTKAVSTSLPFPFEFIIVDNGSIDQTSEQIKLKHPDVNLVIKQKNNGIAGWNEGFKAANQKYFLVLDDDSHLESGLIEAINYLEENNAVGILALNVTTGPFTTGAMQWKDKQELSGFFGCGAIIRKSLYDKIGGFAEWVHVYAHEWEYGIRCLDAGYSIRYFANSNVVHRASTTNRSFKRIRIYSTRNEMGIVFKYFGNDRWKYLFKMWIDNLKRIKDVGFLYCYYEFLGSLKFLVFKSRLSHTPVSRSTQEFFVAHYINPNPIFGFITKRFDRLIGRNKGTKIK